jgi:hypothetical protein
MQVSAEGYAESYTDGRVMSSPHVNGAARNMPIGVSSLALKRLCERFSSSTRRVVAVREHTCTEWW